MSQYGPVFPVFEEGQVWKPNILWEIVGGLWWRIEFRYEFGALMVHSKFLLSDRRGSGGWFGSGGFRAVSLDFVVYGRFGGWMGVGC